MQHSVLSRRLESWVDPQKIFSSLYRSSNCAFWLDSAGEDPAGTSYLGEAASGFSVVSANVQQNAVWLSDPRNPLPGKDFLCDITGNAERTADTTIFDFLRREIGAAPLESAGEPNFRLGWLGWLGYELSAQTEQTPLHASRYPDARLMFVDRSIACDHSRQTLTLSVFADAEGAETWLEETSSLCAELARKPDTAVAATQGFIESEQTKNATAVTWRHSPDSYLRKIQRCRDFIAAGDAYQLCLTNEVRINKHPDPYTTYCALRAMNPSHHGGFLRFGDVALLSSSPEQFLSVSPDGVVVTKPIKGTRPRGHDSESDAAQRRELLNSEKERAENVMIVDLMRNDLSRIAVPGTVEVTKLCDSESYATVHQLVSTVRARLAQGQSGVDVVEKCFPAGSMTGAPKRSAITILSELEQGPRGVYSGVFGYFGLDGRVDVAMVIRSMVIDSEGVSVGTGGGITALSVAEEELQETFLKVAPLLRVLGISEPSKLFSTLERQETSDEMRR